MEIGLLFACFFALDLNVIRARYCSRTIPPPGTRQEQEEVTCAPRGNVWHALPWLDATVVHGGVFSLRLSLCCHCGFFPTLSSSLSMCVIGILVGNRFSCSSPHLRHRHFCSCVGSHQSTTDKHVECHETRGSVTRHVEGQHSWSAKSIHGKPRVVAHLSPTLMLARVTSFRSRRFVTFASCSLFHQHVFHVRVGNFAAVTRVDSAWDRLGESSIQHLGWQDGESATE